jgi:pimeloyl-ACP methyl ester carboxylesterase
MARSKPSRADYVEAIKILRRYAHDTTLPEDFSIFGASVPGELGAEFEVPDWIGAVADRLGDAGRSIADLVSLFTYYQMKARAGIVGENGVREMLDKLQRRIPRSRLHLFGHSFGCKLMLSAVGDRDRPLHRSVTTLVLLQAAISLESFAPRVTGTDVPGGYRRVLDPERVSGPIIVTYSSKDDALATWYPLASRLRGQTGETEAAGPTKYDAMGAWGAWGRGPANFKIFQYPQKLEPKGVVYSPGLSRAVWNIDCDVAGGIRGHSTIFGEKVAWLLWSAVLAGR